MAYVKYYYDPSEPNAAYDENTLAGCVDGGEGYEKVDSSSSASTARKETIYFCIDGVPSGSTITKVQVDFQCKHLTWQNAGGLLYKTDLKWKPVILTGYSLSGNKITSLGTVTDLASLASIYSKTGTFTSYTSKSYNASFSKTVSGSNLVGVAFEIGSYNTLGDIHFWFKGVSITVTYTAPHSHSYTTETARTASTCYTEGSVTKQCSCGQTQTTKLALDPNNHAGGTEIRNAVTATCTATGYTGDTYCKGCGAKISSGSTIAKKAHTEVTLSAVAPTCTATGLTAGKKCSVCNTIITAQQTVPAKGHNYTSQVIKPTEAVDGYTLHTCQNGCGSSYKDNYTINKIYSDTVQPKAIYYDSKNIVFVVDGTVPTAVSSIFDTVDGFNIKVQNTVPSGMTEVKEVYRDTTKVYG